MKRWNCSGFMRVVPVLLLVMGLTACVYTRLLSVKNQLSDFDKNFGVRVTGGQFILDFRHPVLYDEDFVTLTHLNPARVAPLPQGHQWFLDFSPESAAASLERPPQKITFTMTFGADHKLQSWGFSPLFLQMAPPAFLEASIRSLGKGTILQSHRQLKVDYHDLPRIEAAPPGLDEVVKALGQPGEIQRKDALDVYVYRFRADSSATDSDYEARRLAEAKLYMDPASRRLVKMSSRFAGLKISIDYRKMSTTHVTR